MARQSYYLFRYGNKEDGGGYGYRMEKADTVEKACQLAFGTVYKAPYNGNVVYKNIGTRSPRYISQKAQQGWYGPDGWEAIS